MAPLTPFWAQPSHPEVQKVLFSTEKDFTTKSLSTVSLPPFAFFAKMAFPPCTLAEKATYATVQIGRDTHTNLNSDLVYINHSCVPSVIFDTTSRSILAGPSGLEPGQELTFFYPSTEWEMAQGFDCFCGAETCRGFIAGAKQMKTKDLEGLWLNAHIRELLEERLANAGSHGTQNGSTVIPAQGQANGSSEQKIEDATEVALLESLKQAEKLVEAAKHALDTYVSHYGKVAQNDGAKANGVGSRELSGEMGGDTNGNGAEGEQRRGVTSREMSGEMGGDTSSAPLA
ncbi:hypothetical protein LSUE1_G007872 [Lachnellula suecica]|uniref:Post-SET domain-containing protein n=1 Tax=Lachnellula suecica TaxID=602035 RepID=A0A8T9C6X1_9HELO|nr:hypothetical protein LSUE1_G007872 [Lachnellula suecica]